MTLPTHLLNPQGCYKNFTDEDGDIWGFCGEDGIFCDECKAKRQAEIQARLDEKKEFLKFLKEEYDAVESSKDYINKMNELKADIKIFERMK